MTELLLDDIAVVGISCVFPGAKDVASFWDNIVNSRSGIQTAPEARIPGVFFDPDAKTLDRHAVNRGGFVNGLLEFDPIEFGMVPNSIGVMEAEHLAALKLAKVALEDAGVFDKKLSLENTAIIIGKGNFGGKHSERFNQIVEGGENLANILRNLLPQVDEEAILQAKRAYQGSLGNFDSQNIMGIVPNLTASLVANRLNFGGPAYTIDAACASSLVAIESGIRELQSGRCDLALAGAIHLLQCPAMYSFFGTLGALSQQQEARPFDQNADGILTGEGCGFVVLKRLKDAVADKHRIYAVIKGLGVSSDGSSASVMSPASSGQVKAIERAWAMTGYDHRDLGFLEAHGTGTRLGDETELQTLITAFPGTPDQPKAAIGAVKALIGHAMAAAGMAGFIKAAMALYKGVIPPSVNCDTPLEAMGQSRFQPFATAVEWASTGLPMRAGVNAFGFGGINAHAVLEPYQDAAPAVSDEVLLLARHSQEALIKAIVEGETRQGEGNYRIAVCNPTAKRRELAERIVRKGIEWKDRQDIWFTSNPLLHEGKLAFVFPGLDMLAVSSLNDAHQAELITRLDLDTPALELNETKEEAPQRLEYFQYLISDALKKLGIKADAVTGHSLGEWTAARSIALLTKEQLDRIDEKIASKKYAPVDISFLSVGCGVEALHDYLRNEGDYYISNDNCPHQVVISAAPDQAEHLQKILLSHGVITHLLPFKTGYHTPHAEIYVPGAREALADVGQLTPSTPIWSCIYARQYQPEDKASDLVADFIVKPVRFRDMINDMYAHGIKVFIQIGDGALPGFIADILNGKPHSVVSSGSAKRGVIAQLKRVLGCLFVEGKHVNLDAFSDSTTAEKTSTRRGMASQINLDFLAIDVASKLDPQTLEKFQTADNTTTEPAFKQHLLTLVQDNLNQINQAQDIFLNVIRQTPLQATQPQALYNIKKTIEFSHDYFPYLIDHCPFRKRALGNSFDKDQQPIVPFTLFIDLVTELFLFDHPHLQVAKITDVKVHNFLWLKPGQQLQIEGNWEDSGCIKFEINNVFEARVHPQTGAQPNFTRITSEQELPIPVQASEVYSQGYMFHGPLYQGIREIRRLTENTLETRLIGTAVKGALLDNMGQTFGLLNHFSGRSLRSFPVGVGEVIFFQNPLDQTGNFTCVAQLNTEDNDFHYSTIQLLKNDQPWCQFNGWKTKKSDLDTAGWQLISRTEGRQLSAQLGDGIFLLEKSRYKQANSWFIMKEIYLNQSEINFHDNLPLAKQRDFLLGQIAAKDAVTSFIATHYGDLVHPASLHVQFLSEQQLQTHYKGNIIHTSLYQIPQASVAYAYTGTESKALRLENIEFAHTDFTAQKALEEKQRLACATKIINSQTNLNLHFDGHELRYNGRIVRTLKYLQYLIAFDV